MEAKMEHGLVWQELCKRGMTLKKMSYEWKKKGHFLAGKANLLGKEYELAIENLEQALRLGALAGGESNSDEAKLMDMLQLAQKKRAAERKKEKHTWSKAFEKNSAEPAEPEPEAAATASTPVRAPLPLPVRPDPANGEQIDLSVAGIYGNIFGLGKGNDFSNEKATHGKDVDDKGKSKGTGKAKDQGKGSDPSNAKKAESPSLTWALGFGAVACVVTIATFAFMRSKRS
jgi:hypothetical protein